MMPLTHIQYITIPSPLSQRNKNYYPLTIVLSIIWIFLYSFIIVQFTLAVTVHLNLPFSIIPMFIYPIGVSIRDVKKFQDFRLSIQVFKDELPDQEISLAETYSPQIFQMTGLAGFAWFCYIVVENDQVQFEQQSIQYQVPLLIIVVLYKYFMLFYYGFKTHKNLWKANLYGFLVFLILVLIIEYELIKFT